MHPKYTWARSVRGSSISTCFINFFHIGAIFHFFPAILMSSTYTDSNDPCLRWTNIHSQFGIFSHPRLLSIVFSMAIRFLEDRTNVVQEVPRDLPYWTMIWGICVSVDVSKHLNIPNLEFCAFWEHPPIFTCELADTASAAYASQPGDLAMTSMIFAAFIWDAEEPCSVKTAKAPELSWSTWTVFLLAKKHTKYSWCQSAVV